jgi:hypothetical protein
MTAVLRDSTTAEELWQVHRHISQAEHQIGWLFHQIIC